MAQNGDWFIVNPRYPVYIISKGRAESRLTAKALDKINVPYHIVVEPQELDAYASVIAEHKILTLPFSNLGSGSIPARNWVWEHAQQTGAERHWILDDNIGYFVRFHENKKIKVDNGVGFAVIEDFVDRYENVAIAGMQYIMFAPALSKFYPFRLNTRIYSCILLNHKLKMRWRGRYNEDTDLSIRALKEGWCTVLCNQFLCEKRASMSMTGGNTESLYLLENGNDGRLLMAQSLQQQHPDVVTISRKWNRWQHKVNYKPFKNNRLVKKQGVVIATGKNEYGMVLKSHIT